MQYLDQDNSLERSGSEDSEHSEAEETIEIKLLDAVKSRPIAQVRRLCQETEVDVALRVKCARLAIEWNSKEEFADRDAVEILRLLLEVNLGEQSFSQKHGHALLCVAVHEMEIECLKYLVESLELNVNCRDKNGFTPLYVAVKTGWVEGVVYLLEKNADMTIVNGVKNSANEAGSPGASAGSSQGRENRKKTRIQRAKTMSKINELGQETKTAIQLAVGLKPTKDSGRSAGDLAKIFHALVETARRIDDKDKILNVCNSEKKTPLFIAVLSQNLQYVKILLEAGADMTLLDKEDLCVLHWASKKGTPKIMEALLKHRAREMKRIQTDIKANSKDEEAKNDAETNGENTTESSTKNKEDQLLVKLKCLPRQICKGKIEGNPLHLAVYYGDIQNTELLMNEGSDSIFDVAKVRTSCQVKPSENYNILHLASLSKNAEVVKYFNKNMNNRTPEKCARKNLCHDLRALAREKTEPNKFTPLHLAIMTQKVGFVFALIAAGSDLSAECFNESTQCNNTAMFMLIYQMPPSLMMMTNILDRAIKKHKKNVFVEIDFTVLMSASECQDQIVDEGSSNAPRTKNGGQNPQNVDQSAVPSVDNVGQSTCSATENVSQNGIQSNTAMNSHHRNPISSQSTTIPIEDDAGDNKPLLGDSSDDGNREFSQGVHEPTNQPLKQENKFAVLNALQETGNLLEQRQHLQHPLVECFLYLHWKRLQGPYAILVFLHVAFAFLITLTIVFNLVHENFTAARVLGFTSFFIMTMIFFQGLQSLNAQDASKLYLAESFTKLAGFYLATKVVRHSCSSHIIQTLYDSALFVMILLHIILLVQTQNRKAQWTWGFWANFLPALVVGCFLPAVNFLLPYSPHDISAFAILFVWFEVLLLVSRIPHYGYYMLMFIEVAFSYLKLLLSFLFIIVGFTLVFMLIFRGHSPFDGSLPALMKTIVMMNNEFEYNTLSDTILSNNKTENNPSSSAGVPLVNLNISEFFKLYSTYEKPSAVLNLSSFSQITAMVFFIIFIISVGLVMTNIFVGVAVNDIQKLQIISKQIEFLGSFDQFLLGTPLVGSRGLANGLFEGLCWVLARLGMTGTVERWNSYKIIGRFYSIDGSKPAHTSQSITNQNQTSQTPTETSQQETNIQKQPPLHKNRSVSSLALGCPTESTPIDGAKVHQKIKFPKKLKSEIIAKGYANREQQEQRIAIYEKETKDEQRAKAKQKAKEKDRAEIAKMGNEIVKIQEQLVKLSAQTAELLVAMRQEN